MVFALKKIQGSLELFGALLYIYLWCEHESNLDPILHFRCHLLAKLYQQLDYKIEFELYKTRLGNL